MADDENCVKEIANEIGFAFDYDLDETGILGS